MPFTSLHSQLGCALRSGGSRREEDRLSFGLPANLLRLCPDSRLLSQAATRHAADLQSDANTKWELSLGYQSTNDLLWFDGGNVLWFCIVTHLRSIEVCLQIIYKSNIPMIDQFKTAFTACTCSWFWALFYELIHEPIGGPTVGPTIAGPTVRRTV